MISPDLLSLPIILDNGVPRFMDRELWPMDWDTIMEFAPNDPIRAIERASIRAYMELHRDKLTGRVLDFGCGTQPYRDLVSGKYYGWDADHQYTDLLTVADVSLAEPFDCVMCNQVLQYNMSAYDMILRFRRDLRVGGYLVMTYATNWDEVEGSDWVRHTKAHITRLLSGEFTILDHTRRAEVRIGNFCFPLGYGVVAQKLK